MTTPGLRHRGDVDAKAIDASTPHYTLIEAAMFTRLSPATVRYWTRGRGKTQALIRAEGDMLSFTNVIEVHMVSVFRGLHDVPLQRIRRALATLAARFPNETHPLVTRKFWTDGYDILNKDLDGGYVSLVDRGQRMLPVVAAQFDRVAWDGSTPTKFYPWTVVNGGTAATAASQRRSVVIDPSVAFGRSVITDTRVTTKAIKDLWDVGMLVEHIADEFDVKPIEVQDAVRLEEGRRRAG